MLSPEYIQGISEPLEELSIDLERFLLEDIARRIAKVGSITDTAAYEIERLKELGAATDYIEKKLAEFTELSAEEISRLFFDAAQTDNDFYEEVYSRTNREFIPFEYNEFLQQYERAAVNQTLGELENLTRSMGFSLKNPDGTHEFKGMTDAYRELLDEAFFAVSTGALDYRTAVRNAVTKLADGGVCFIGYDSGVINHADVAVRRAVLTGVSQLASKISEYNAEKLDTDVVEVTAHAGARPTHAVWQGGWYSLTGKDKRYALLSEATGYGRADGLMGANCRHSFFPVIPGVDTPMYTKEQLEHIDPPPVTIDGKTYTYYEATQRQRAMERAMRKTKRQLIAAQAAGAEDLFTEKSILLRRQTEAYAEFSKKAGLLARPERYGVVGYGRSISAKAAWRVRKAQTGKLPNGAQGSSGGHSVAVNISGGSNGGTGLAYTSQNIPQNGLTNGGNGGTINMITVNGIEVKSGTLHFDERLSERGVSQNDVENALTNPLKVHEIKTDNLGRKSQRFIGEKATVNVNPDTGAIITVWKTGKKTAEKYRKEQNDE